MATLDGVDDAAPAVAASELRISAPLLIFVVWSLIALILVLGIRREAAAIAAGVFTTDYGFYLFMLDGEANLPAAVSSLLLLLAAMLLLVQSRAVAVAREARYWLILSIGFLYLSVDEVAQLHEQLKEPLRAMATFTDLLSFPWVIVAIPLVIAAALFFLPFLARLPRALAASFLLAGVVYVGGAVGMEMLNGRLATYAGWGSVYYLVGMAIEEALELSGIGLFLSALLRHMAAENVAVRLRILG